MKQPHILRQDKTNGPKTLHPNSIISRWESRLAECKQFNSLVDGARICEEILEDLRSWQEAEENQLLSLKAAAELSGYTADHLGRLVQQGKIPNAGRPNAPKICRRDVPIKPGVDLSDTPFPVHIAQTSREQIARSIVNADQGGAR